MVGLQLHQLHNDYYKTYLHLQDGDTRTRTPKQIPVPQP